MVPLARRVRPWYVVLLVWQALLLSVRWSIGDTHGAILMLAGVSVGVLAICAGDGGTVDVIYACYCGLIALVCGMIDLCFAINMILLEFGKTSFDKPRMTPADVARWAKPALLLLCTVVQFGLWFVGFLLFKEATRDDEELPLYHSGLMLNETTSHHTTWVTRPAEGESAAAPLTPKIPAETAFTGKSFKLSARAA
eukprot:TRINITY_DN65591_c0_g1_i1.p1 TRINITY_DN65591_c0_g1~~TRINITY_DN65591_c0_g1_i1.p1  ORF type:complete len:196 (+),score=31.02 TRINITY_DN65591_c0_g1_i1:95-682(+)